MAKCFVIFVSLLLTCSLAGQEKDTSFTVIDSADYGFKISGSADTYYRVGTNNAQSQTSLILENKEIGFGSFNCLMEYNQKRYGAVLHLAAGPRAEQFYYVDENAYLKYFRQSYVYANITSSLRIHGGTMVAMPGYEADEPNQNPLYSTSYLNTLTPAIYTGLWATYNLNNKWNVMVGGFNDTDRRIDRAKGKHLGMMLSYENNDLSTSLSNFRGKESYGMLNVTDFIIDYEINKKNRLTLEILYNYIIHESVNNSYSGANLYYSRVMTGSSEFNLRGEFLDDRNGFSFGVSNNTLYGITSGFKIKFFNHYVFMPEIRFDTATKLTYINDIGDREKSVTSLVFGLSYVFGDN